MKKEMTTSAMAAPTMVDSMDGLSIGIFLNPAGGICDSPLRASNGCAATHPDGHENALRSLDIPGEQKERRA